MNVQKFINSDVRQSWQVIVLELGTNGLTLLDLGFLIGAKSIIAVSTV